ncbi:MAG: hypothetical protein U0169_02185 [Polyangiaceae bacterium]
MRDITLVELNGLSRVLTHRFIAEGVLPSFKREAMPPPLPGFADWAA